MKFQIQTPIWKTRSVGLNVNLLSKDNTVDILYKGADGKRLFPLTFKITRDEAMKYPRDLKNSFLVVIPISDLK